MSTTAQTAKLFVNGRSQAVRLPKPYRFEGLTEVFIERDGDRVILSPTRKPSIERLISALDQFEKFPSRAQPRRVDRRDPL
jgi:antitoxin VapB